ncbi:hypothetical protein QZH41_002913 [Actinostola sp. cb2023]|nr:hypothetical protein QZH41_002913 [Actinostola sp. cb2023]
MTTVAVVLVCYDTRCVSYSVAMTCVACRTCSLQCSLPVVIAATTIVVCRTRLRYSLSVVLGCYDMRCLSYSFASVLAARRNRCYDNRAVPALPPVSSVTPLKHDRFALELQGHPDQERVSYVLNGIRLGFKLGFDHAPDLRSAKRNKKSADDHPTVIDEYLANEVALGRVAGPFAHPPIPQLHISSFGVIPKNGQPGKWRLIVDLSSPAGSSVNDGIDVDSFSLQYIRVDDIVKMVSKFGFGALIAKFDVLTAYRNVAIHPSDRARSSG